MDFENPFPMILQINFQFWKWISENFENAFSIALENGS